MTKEELFDVKNDKFREELVLDIAYFCKPYVSELCDIVVSQIEFILENPGIQHLLRQLRIRGEQEQKEFNNKIGWRIYEVIRQEITESEYDIHNCCMTHAGSYRDVLYDILIKNFKREEL